MNLETDINKFMDENYVELKLSNVRENKVIHMANLGTHHFSNHEMAIIDTPVVQRLKYITQLGQVYNVFPTARHSRFEHTLGVAISVNKMWNFLSENGSLSFLRDVRNKAKILSDLRICAILHDIGHCPFSHVSEIVLRDFTPIEDETRKLGGKPHEIIGHYMLKSDVFKAFFENLYKHYKIYVNPEEISNYLLGKVNNPDENQYIADLINGQIDSDKLDYIIRDSDFSGVQLALGIDRLLLSLCTDKIPTSDGRSKHRMLIVNEKGIMPLEQLVLAKIMLYSSIYHHQKVRAIDHMIISILRMIYQDKTEINGIPVQSPIDLLRLDELDLLKLSSDNSKINSLCKQLKNRQTFKRCLVISPRTLEPDKYQNQFDSFLSYAESPKMIRELNKELAERIGNECTEFDVAIDLPETPRLGETQQKIIKMGNDLVPLTDIFPYSGWLQSYMSNKWKGHIFASDDYRKKASVEGKAMLEEKFEFKFNENAITDAKILPLYKSQRTIPDFL
ncbi:HD domain protein [uncultured archaeon]|nr:HD domain protein [uncultured archaeon]